MNFDSTHHTRPGFRVLTQAQLEDLHDASMRILACTGVKVANEEARSLLRKAGAFVDGELVKIPGHLVGWAARTAPRNVTIYSRNGRPDMELGRRRSYFGTGSDTLHVIDPYTGARRDPVLEDVGNFARLCDALSRIDFVMCMGVASDVNCATAELNHFYAMVCNTAKPVVYTATTLEGARAVVEMAEIVAGGTELFRQKPFGVMYIEPISPLYFAPEPTGKLLFAAEKGIPCIFMSGMMSGASGPVTLPGSLALANAESLAGLLIAQLKREGTPVISGGGILTTDMSTGGPAYGAPEFMLSSAAIAEIAQFYGLPSWGYAGCSDSKLFDEQAAADAAQWVLMSALAGANLIHDVGYLEGGLTSSFDMLVFTDEMIGKTQHILNGIAVNAETLALGVIDEVGPGGHYLAADHTSTHFRSNWFPSLEDRRSYDGWTGAGSPTMRERVNAKVRTILETHRPATLPPVIQKALLDFMRSRGASVEVAGVPSTRA